MDTEHELQKWLMCFKNGRKKIQNSDYREKLKTMIWHLILHSNNQISITPNEINVYNFGRNILGIYINLFLFFIYFLMEYQTTISLSFIIFYV